MHIGILQTGHAPAHIRAKHGDYDAMFDTLFQGQGFHYTTWNVVDMEFPQSPSDADGWLVTGSAHGAYEEHAFIPPLEDFLREIRAANRPLVGICFGHQIIAQAFGGKVEKFKGGWKIGRDTYDFDGAEITANAIHQDQVVSLGPGATLRAASKHCAHAAISYGPNIFTVQPHPEIHDGVLEDFIEEDFAKSRYPEEQVREAHENLSMPNMAEHFTCALAETLKSKSPA
ncbi:MAG: type 1 glutamine amidotransferase [Pseudomonadota bacterium]